MLDSNKKHKEKLINYLSLINDKNLINSEIPLFYEIILLILILVISIFSRFYRLSTIPGIINRDEAFQGYIAYTLLKFGVDSYGKRFPVYLTVWGDGASVLQSIIEIPFVYFMDLTVFAIRIPTAICSVINLLIVYLMIKKFKGNQIALFSTYLLTISP
jgi:4-amino-4-deoxy-L-arabinose transferase-like glycosyltransferase